MRCFDGVVGVLCVGMSRAVRVEARARREAIVAGQLELVPVPEVSLSFGDQLCIV